MDSACRLRHERGDRRCGRSRLAARSGSRVGRGPESSAPTRQSGIRSRNRPRTTRKISLAGSCGSGAGFRPRSRRPAPRRCLARAHRHGRLALDVEQQCCAGLNFGYFYEASPIIVYDDEKPPGYSMGSYTPSTVPGCRAPHIWLDGRRSLYDVLGRGYTLLRMDPSWTFRPSSTQPHGGGFRSRSWTSMAPKQRPIAASWCWYGPISTWRGAPTPAYRFLGPGRS